MTEWRSNDCKMKSNKKRSKSHKVSYSYKIWNFVWNVAMFSHAEIILCITNPTIITTNLFITFVKNENWRSGNC